MAENALRLHFSAIMHENASPDRTAVGLHSLEFHLDPVWFSLNVVAQQRRWFVHVDDENVDVAVIVEIAEGTSATAMGSSDRRGQPASTSSSKVSIAKIAKNTRGESCTGTAEACVQLQGKRYP